MFRWATSTAKKQKRKLIVLYEDEERTGKLLEQMSGCPRIAEVEIEMMDAGENHAVVSIAGPSHATMSTKEAASGGQRKMLFSRCSGSFGSRGNSQSPSLIEAVICRGESSEDYAVFNGSKAFRVEMNKSLATFHIAGSQFQRRCQSRTKDGVARLRVPRSVLVTKLSPKLVESAAKRIGSTGPCFLKGIVGGGSSTVTRVDTSMPVRSQLKKIEPTMRATGVDGDLFIMQESAPSTLADVQYRFELIGGRFHYAVRIEAAKKQRVADSKYAHEVENLCMCDIDADDPSVRLSILKSAEELGREPGMQNSTNSTAAAQSLIAAMELFAADFDLHVVAIEGTLSDGMMFAFDINTNSNYNYTLEKRSGVTPGAWRLLESMLTH